MYLRNSETLAHKINLIKALEQNQVLQIIEELEGFIINKYLSTISDDQGKEAQEREINIEKDRYFNSIHHDIVDKILAKIKTEFKAKNETINEFSIRIKDQVFADFKVNETIPYYIGTIKKKLLLNPISMYATSKNLKFTSISSFITKVELKIIQAAKLLLEKEEIQHDHWAKMIEEEAYFFKNVDFDIVDMIYAKWTEFKDIAKQMKKGDLTEAENEILKDEAIIILFQNLTEPNENTQTNYIKEYAEVLSDRILRRLGKRKSKLSRLLSKIA